MGTTVTAIDLDAKTVTAEGPDGVAKVDYDDLVIATGAAPVVPDWARAENGATLPGTGAVSTLDDGQEWLDRIETGEDVVVAGGGYDASDGVAGAGVCVERGGVNCCPDSCGAVEHIRQSGALRDIPSRLRTSPHWR